MVHSSLVVLITLFNLNPTHLHTYPSHRQSQGPDTPHTYLLEQNSRYLVLLHTETPINGVELIYMASSSSRTLLVLGLDKFGKVHSFQDAQHGCGVDRHTHSIEVGSLNLKRTFWASLVWGLHVDCIL